MSVYCKSKEGKEIIDALMSYITLETLSDDKCKYDIQEEGDFLNKEYTIFFRSGRKYRTYLYFVYDIKLTINETKENFDNCEMTIVFDSRKIDNKSIKKELLKMGIITHRFEYRYNNQIIKRLAATVTKPEQVYQLISLQREKMSLA